MKLQYALPVWAETLPGIVPEEVRYCVPYDLTAEGRFLRDGYLAVTRERLFVLEEGRILRDIPLRQGTEIVCSPRSLPPGSTGRWRAGSGSSTAIGAAAFCPARPCVRNATVAAASGCGTIGIFAAGIPCRCSC